MIRRRPGSAPRYRASFPPSFPLLQCIDNGLPMLNRPYSQLMLSAALGLALLSMPGVQSAARAQGFPSKPVKVILPSPPGGGTDALARILADKLRSNDQLSPDDETAPVDIEDATDGTPLLQPRRPDEEHCQQCFLLVRKSAPKCPVDHDLCPLFPTV